MLRRAGSRSQWDIGPRTLPLAAPARHSSDMQLPHGRSRTPRAPRREILVAVAQFSLSGLLVLALVGVGGAYALGRLGTSEAVSDARRLTAVTARGIVEPALADGIVRSSPTAVRRL